MSYTDIDSNLLVTYLTVSFSASAYEIISFRSVFNVRNLKAVGNLENYNDNF